MRAADGAGGAASSAFSSCRRAADVVPLHLQQDAEVEAGFDAVGVHLQHTVEVGHRLLAAAGAGALEGAREEGVGVVRSQLDGAIEVGQGVLLPAGAAEGDAEAELGVGEVRVELGGAAEGEHRLGVAFGVDQGEPELLVVERVRRLQLDRRQILLHRRLRLPGAAQGETERAVDRDVVRVGLDALFELRHRRLQVAGRQRPPAAHEVRPGAGGQAAHPDQDRVGEGDADLADLGELAARAVEVAGGAQRLAERVVHLVGLRLQLEGGPEVLHRLPRVARGGGGLAEAEAAAGAGGAQVEGLLELRRRLASSSPAARCTSPRRTWAAT